MKKYNFHDDFHSLDKIDLRTESPRFLKLLNEVLRVQRRSVKPPGLISDENYTITGYNDLALKVKVIQPKNQADQRPALLFLHGGGFALDVTNTHIERCYTYAEKANCVVVIPYYHLIPKHPFPAAFEDSYKTLEWMLSQATELGIEATNIGIIGESCGGALAAGIAQKCRDENGPALKFQSLIYPVTDHTSAFPSMNKFDDAPVWKKKHNLNMWQQYLDGHHDLPKYAVPYAAPFFEHLPPAYIEVCEVDCLRDEGLAYAQKLQEAGVPTEINDIAQACHGFAAIATSHITQTALEKRVRVFNHFFEQ